MKKLLLFLFFFVAYANAQPIVSIPDANFKNYLLNEPTINTNGDSEIQVAEAEATTVLLPINLNIQSLQGIEAFANLVTLDCNQNLLLPAIDLSANLKLEILQISGSNIESLDLSGLSLLRTLDVNENIRMNSLNLSGCDALEFFQANGSPITNLDLSNKTQLLHVTLNVGFFNPATTVLGTLNLSGCPALNQLFIFQNGLTSINVTGCVALTDLTCESSTLQSINLTGCTNIRSLNFSESSITDIDLSDCTALSYFDMSFSSLTTVDFSNNPNLDSVQLLNCPDLRYINLKNGKNEFLIDVISPSLEFICVDESQLLDFQQRFNQEGDPLVSTYCSFFPGGNYNTITGKMRFDETNNGCDDTDFSSEFMKIKINDGTNEATTVVNTTGDYNFYTNAGNFTLTPQFENPSYFTVSPATATVNFPSNDNSVTTQNFCTTVNGVHPDLEIMIVPLDFARPGFDSHYKIVYKNKGNQTLSGNISFSFDDTVLDFISSSPAVNSQATGLLTFNYSNLRPFENRSITLTLNANAPTEIPAVNIDDVLVFSAAITPVTADEMPDDNVFNFTQTVVGSFDPNDKQCIEGSVVSPAQIGKYLHYVINFENTGTHVAENVVVKDIINTDQFNMDSLQILNASAEMDVKINGNVIEFIFKAIRLPIGGHGNVLFKIKTKNNLPEGTTVSNQAEIFFDYNFPIVTDPVKTHFQTLSTTVFDSDQAVRIHPNPASNSVQIQSEIELKSVELYDVQGRVLVTKEAQGKQAFIDISAQDSGLYLLKVISDKGAVLKKIMKK